MHRHGPRVASALLAALLLAAVLPATLPRAADTAGEDDNKSTSFAWQAPKNLTGTFAAEIQVKYNTATTCKFLSAAEGTVRDDIPLIFWESAGPSDTYLRNAERVHAHAAGVRTGPATLWDYGPYSQGGGIEITKKTAPATINWTIAAFGIENDPDDGPDHPMTVEVTCEDPVEIRLRGSRQAVGFTEQSFTDGGAGLSVYPSYRDHVIVQRNATIEAAFDTEMVRVKADLAASEKPSGTFTLDRPNGTDSWKLTRDVWHEYPGSPWGLGVVDGPGDYTLELSVADRIEDFGLPGVVVGLDPVDSLDDVAETCDPNNPLGEPDPCLEV